MKRLWFLVLGVLVLDGVTKGVVHACLVPFGASVPVFHLLGVDFSLLHAVNRGMAWGVGSGWQNLVLVGRIGVVAAIGAYAFLSERARVHRYALALIVAGGIGNILDTFIYGHVVDMFHFVFWGYSYPVFNVADASIFLGIVGLLWKKREMRAA